SDHYRLTALGAAADDTRRIARARNRVHFCSASPWRLPAVRRRSPRMRRTLTMGNVSIGASEPTPILSSVWSRIIASPRRLLMLDYAGTLAAFRADGERAMPTRRIREALRAVATIGEPVIVVSGRPLAQLQELLHGIPVDLVGEHGWEEMTQAGDRQNHPLPQASVVRLGLAYRAAAACGWRSHLETKRASVVLHTPGMPAEAAPSLEGHCPDLWTRFFERDGLRLEDIDGGLELRATQRGKGTVAWEATQREPQGTLPVYLGDDIADEDAFRVLRPFGVTIRVGRRHLPTAAEWRIGSIDDVPAFLEHWKSGVARR